MSQNDQNQAVQGVYTNEPVEMSTPTSIATSESLKEVLRWTLSFGVADLLTKALALTPLLPKEIPIYFQGSADPLFLIYAQAAARMTLTLLIRGWDKYRYYKGKTEAARGEPSVKRNFGLFWF